MPGRCLCVWYSRRAVHVVPCMLTVCNVCVACMLTVCNGNKSSVVCAVAIV